MYFIIPHTHGVGRLLVTQGEATIWGRKKILTPPPQGLSYLISLHKLPQIVLT